MIDLLFIEFGAAVTEVLGRTRCTVEPWCDPAKPPYGQHGRVEVDFARALSRESVHRARGAPISAERAALRAWFDPHDSDPLHGFGNAAVGPSFPGGKYEGIVSILEEDVNANATLATAVARFPGHRWEYQVVVSVDEATGVARHYHGFHAEILKDDGDTLVLLVANARMSALPDWAATARAVPYDPTDTRKFYAGARVAEHLVAAGSSRRRSGAVYMTAEAAASFGIDVPKLPPGLGASSPEPPVPHAPPPGLPMLTDPERTVTAIQPASDSFLKLLADEMAHETVFPNANDEDAASVQAQRRKRVQDLFAGAELVDLVGHSTPIKCYLKLGNWVLDPHEAERLASYMPPSVKRVRLIGCATAKTSDGCAAARALARSGRLAYGTVNNVYTTHFDRNGVKRGIGAPALRAFSPSGSVADPPPPTVDVTSPPVFRIHAPDVAAAPDPRGAVDRFLAWLRRHPWLVISAPFAVIVWLIGRLFARPEVPHRWVWWLLGPLSAEMPGLLTEPLLTYEIRTGRELWTLEILFDFERARFYSSTDSAAKKQRVYRIRRSAREVKTMLEAYLPGTTLRDAAVKGQVLLRRRHAEAGSRGGVLESAPIEAQPPERT